MPADGLKYAVPDGYDALPEDEVVRRLQLLARTQAGERPRQIAADLGVTSRQVRRWTAWARRHMGVSWEVDQRKRRRRMLEMRNAGYSYGVIADAFGISESMVGNALPIAWREAYADVDGWGPPAEPLLDWLRQLPLEDAAGMPEVDLLAQAEAAMGHPVAPRLLWRKLSREGWRIRMGCLMRRKHADAPAVLPEAA